MFLFHDENGRYYKLGWVVDQRLVVSYSIDLI